MQFSLRDLPLPVKVVASVFLMAVGAGYSAAMLQLHVQDSKSGKPMPTPEDVVLKFTGKKWCDTAPPPPPSKFVLLVNAPRSAAFTGNGTMAPAFFEKSSDWKRANEGREIRAAGPLADPALLLAEREGEQGVTALWGEAAEDVRKKAYEEDKFTPAADKAPKAITPKFKNADGTIKIKSIIDARCARCHKKDGDDSNVEKYPLTNYTEIEKYLRPPGESAAKEGAGWYRVQEPIGIEKLTQSTHAHLLSFAVLFSLTGLIFACTSYPTFIRCIFGPAVVLAVFADVSLWWLARTCDEWGPYFAYGVIGTGGAAGTALALQILLGLWNMYGAKGKVVVVLLLLLGGGAGTFVFFKNIAPVIVKQAPPANSNGTKPADPPSTTVKLTEEQKKQVREAWEDLKSLDNAKKQAAQQLLDKLVTEARRKRIEEAQKGLQSDKQEARTVAQEELKKLKAECGIADGVVSKLPPSEFERLLEFPVRLPDGKGVLGRAELDQIPFTNGELGNMSRAFFDKEKVYRDAVNNGPMDKLDKLHADRDGEREAMLAWARSEDPARKATYENDSFVLPPDLVGKPITSEYAKDGKVLIKKLIVDRCARCHNPEGKQKDYPLTTYEELRQYLNPPLAPPAPKP